MTTFLALLFGLLGGAAGTWLYLSDRYTRQRIADLEAQLKGRQLPYFVRDGLEDIKALENYDAFDLARVRLYLTEAMKTVDAAAERQDKMGEIYNALRNHKNITK